MTSSEQIQRAFERICVCVRVGGRTYACVRVCARACVYVHVRTRIEFWRPFERSFRCPYVLKPSRLKSLDRKDWLKNIENMFLGQTNLLLVLRREFTSSLHCLYGLITSNSQLTFKSKSTSLPCLSERNFTQTTQPASYLF